MKQFVPACCQSVISVLVALGTTYYSSVGLLDLFESLASTLRGNRGERGEESCECVRLRVYDKCKMERM